MVRSVALAFTLAASTSLTANGESAPVRPGGGGPVYWSPWTPLAPEEPPAPLFPEAEAPEAAPAEAGRLPPPEPDPRIAPVVGDYPQPPAARAPPGEGRWILVRAVLGLTFVVALAFAAAHPGVERLEQRLGIAQLVTAGVPFLLLGIAARHPAVGVLDDRVLVHLGPVLRIALGWIGFSVGFRLDARRLVNVDERAVASAALFSILPFATVLAATGVVLAGGSAELATALRDRVFLRDALVLGAAASMAAATLPRLLRSPASPAARARFGTIVRLEELAGVAGLALVAAYFRPRDLAVEWQIPGA
jgi:hypothetical protein